MRVWQLCLALCATPLLGLQGVETSPVARLEIRVLSNAGEPLSEARVTLSGGGPNPQFAAVSGINGNLKFEHVPFGKWDLNVSLPGFQTHKERIAVYQSLLTFRLGLALGYPHDSERPEVSGSILAVKSRDVSAMWVRLVSLYGGSLIENSVDSYGNFRLMGMEVGSYILLVIDGNKVVATKSVDVTIKRQELRIELSQ